MSFAAAKKATYRVIEDSFDFPLNAAMESVPRAIATGSQAT
jgi:hypothetical protein